MRKVDKGNGWIMTTTPSRIKLVRELSNGQYMTLWFWRVRSKEKGDAVIYVWLVGLYIGSKKGAARWRRTKAKSKQTGECGIEGLRVALSNLRAFASGMSTREEMQVKWEDDKRGRAYRWLLRYPGFTLHERCGKNESFIAYRDPEYWVWIPNEEAENEHVL